MMRLYKSVLMAAMVVALGLGMGSCVDNIDNGTKPGDNPQEEQVSDEQMAKAQKFWAVVSQLVDVDDYTDDYEGKTFEPTYGVSQGDDGTRYVYTNTAAAAAERFADLVDRDDIDETTESYTYQDPDVGRLVYTKGSGRVLATVDVDIKQIPGLKKIVYVPGAYANGTFTGRAYYRFGDVVSRQNINYDGEEFTEYWICVRPAFGPEGKGDSHWVCLSQLPKKNVEHYHSNSNGNDYYLPKGLGKNEEQMQNLAEMLFAIYFPDEWESNIEDYANSNIGLKIFNDFSLDKIQYHNQYFWKNVQDAWRDLGILKKALDYNLGEETFKQMLKGDGLHLFYKGYSWYQSLSWNCSLYEANYKNATLGGKDANMHKAYLKEHTYNMHDKVFDCRQLGPAGMDSYQPFVIGKQPRWAIRHATGKELASGGRYDKQEAIPGVTQVYRYYYNVNMTPQVRKANPEVTEEGIVENAAANGGTYMVGDVVKDQFGNRWFCMQGTPACEIYPEAKDSLATFISFDFNEVDTNGNTIAGLPTANEVTELAYRMELFVASMTKPQKYGYIDANRELGIHTRHILKYTGVSIDKIMTSVDSILTFTSKGKTYNSKGVALILNFAYDDGSKDKQAVCRAIYDGIQAGSERNEFVGISGKSYNNFRFLTYLHYETFAPEKMSPATDDVKGLGINDWSRLWPMTGEKMYLQDVASQDMVDRHAKDDKWATLPLSGSENRRQARSQAERSARPGDYIGRYGSDDTPKTNMFNEPVCFFRVMKVKDIGGKKLNLVSTDGRQLTVVHVQNESDAYSGYYGSLWTFDYCSNAKGNHYLDNKRYNIPLISGLDYLDNGIVPNFIE